MLPELMGESAIIPMEIAATIADPYFGGGDYAGNVFMHNDVSDVSIVEAGGDIIYNGLKVAGTGTLEVHAGRNILMTGKAGAQFGEDAIRSEDRRGRTECVRTCSSSW